MDGEKWTGILCLKQSFVRFIGLGLCYHKS